MRVTLDTESERLLGRIEDATGEEPAAIIRAALRVYADWELTHQPNEATVAVLREVEAGEGLMAYPDLDSLFTRLDRIAHEADQDQPPV